MGFDWIKMESTYIYTDHCVCGGYYELIKNEPVVTTMPPKYPVKCRICNKKAHSMLKSDVEAVKNAWYSK
jgi:hypothetical protein